MQIRLLRVAANHVCKWQGKSQHLHLFSRVGTEVDYGCNGGGEGFWFFLSGVPVVDGTVVALRDIVIDDFPPDSIACASTGF